jgi:hypothetical protein
VSGGARTQAQESLVYIVPFEPLSELRCSLLFDAVIHLGDISTLHPRFRRLTQKLRGSHDRALLTNKHDLELSAAQNISSAGRL